MTVRRKAMLMLTILSVFLAAQTCPTQWFHYTQLDAFVPTLIANTDYLTHSTYTVAMTIGVNGTLTVTMPYSDTSTTVYISYSVGRWYYATVTVSQGTMVGITDTQGTPTTWCSYLGPDPNNYEVELPSDSEETFPMYGTLTAKLTYIATIMANGTLVDVFSRSVVTITKYNSDYGALWFWVGEYITYTFYTNNTPTLTVALEITHTPYFSIEYWSYFTTTYLDSGGIINIPAPSLLVMLLGGIGALLGRKRK